MAASVSDAFSKRFRTRRGQTGVQGRRWRKRGKKEEEEEKGKEEKEEEKEEEKGEEKEMEEEESGVGGKGLKKKILRD